MSNTAVSDRKLPGLPAALESSCMQLRLQPLLQATGGLHIELIKHVPGKRAVLLYSFEDGQRVIGKMYRAGRAMRHHDVLQALGMSLQASTRTPRPLAGWPDLGLVIQEFMPGEVAPHWSTMEGHEASMHRMAEALADLHGSRLEQAPPSRLQEHVRRACHPGLAALSEALPHRVARLREVESAMFAREAATQVDEVVCHGDFGPGQVLMTPRQVSIVDLDGVSRSDAALDVANFMIGLRVHAGMAGRRLAQQFYERYLHQRRCGELPGLPHYQAFAYLRRAMILSRKRPADWEEQTLLMVDRAGNSL